MEEFDPNDFGDDNVKIPMEFKKYPVDKLSNIHTNYKDEYYDRFIKNSEKIFKNIMKIWNVILTMIFYI